ncbi:fatty acid desaturase family protein [Actinospongicola halichondriae]|uniref:fatty acid desaturase family protein n=1 Tax=Actinospongicola halichondriae TaxID=3236844 RepID=UPI003D506393
MVSADGGTRTMVPGDEALPQVLPTDRLLESAKPVREIRDELRQIDDVRNVGSVVLCWAQVAATIGFALHVDTIWSWAIAFVFMGAAHARLAILMHEAAHKLLFSNKRVNDLVGRWIGSYPSLVPMELYRRSHFAHHKEEFGPNEPDLPLYNGYPITRSSMKRKLWRDLRGNTGWKSLKPLVLAVAKEDGFGIARKILLTQVVLAVVLTAWGVWAAGLVGLLTYPVLWLGSWMTIWRVINRLRSIAEHGGMEMSPDRRRTTHHVRQNLLARFWVAPFNTGWHLAHHVDMGVPFRNLPALHRELEDAGWVTDAYTYPNYRSLWRALSSRPE